MFVQIRSFHHQVVEETPPECCLTRNEPKVLQCRSKRITSLLSEKIHRPVTSQSRSARTTIRRRLRDLESDSTGVESEEDFLMSNRWDNATRSWHLFRTALKFSLSSFLHSLPPSSSDDEDFGVSGDDAEEEDTPSDIGSLKSLKHSKHSLRRTKNWRLQRRLHRGKKQRKQRQRRSLEEDSDEETGESDRRASRFQKKLVLDSCVFLAPLSLNSDLLSSVTDSDADLKRRNLRRGQQQQVNYCETSDSSDRSSAARRKNKPGGRPGKQLLSSDFTDG